jgi:NADPH:quinone reductase-like Zn-dependent oxidoreductase
MDLPAHLPRHMTAMLLMRHGGTDALAYRHDVPTPGPAAGEVLIRVGAAGLNNTDIATRTGWYSRAPETGPADQPLGRHVDDGGWAGDAIRFPRIQGADVCGEIVAVGEGVAPARLGSRVIVQSCLVSLRRGDADIWLGSERDGGFAQFVAVPSADAHVVTTPLTDIELASFPCAYGTAENLLRRSGVAAGDTVLVTGATGGLGSAAVQLAKARGASVIAMVSAAKLAEAAVLGADRLIDRAALPSASLGRNSVDVVIDAVGGPAWPDLLEVLKPMGRYAVSGAIAGPIVGLDLRRLYLKDLTLMGCTAQSREGFLTVIRHIERGDIRPLVAGVLPLSELAAAQERFVQKQHIGKLVVVPPPCITGQMPG